MSSPEISRTRCSILAIMNAAQALAISEPRKRFLALMLIELSRSTKPHPTGFRALPAVICTGFDHIPLEDRKAGEDSDQRLTLRRQGIAPREETAVPTASYKLRQLGG